VSVLDVNFLAMEGHSKKPVRLDFVIDDGDRIVVVDCNEDQHRGYNLYYESLRPLHVMKAMVWTGNEKPIIFIA